jgi:beta-galactosidase
VSTPQQLGVCYYPEHWPRSVWETDAASMREAGIAFVRIGEFAWSRLEPNPGEYDLDWLEDAINVLHAEGLKTVLGTPTATPPKWLVDAMPDMLAVDAQGRPRKFGSRRHYCFSHEPYKNECARIVTALAQRFGAHPGVAAWQTDNEYGCHDTVESYSDSALAGFRTWLAEKYGDVSKLNAAWGNVFWSMEYRSFGEIDLPNLTVTEASPPHRLDFQRFSSDQVVKFNRLQTEIIRQYSPGRTILHNFMGSFTAFDHYKVSGDLDAASWDSYPLGFLERDSADDEYKERYLRVGDPDMQAFHHDLYRACGKGRWWVMEQQPGPVNWAPWNPAPAPGAVRLWAYEAFAAGAEAVLYFRWRQAPFAQEQMHEALLLPNSEKNEGWHAVKQVSEELASFGASVETERADVALIFDYESDWAWRIQPQGRDFSYLNLVMDYYRALRRLGVSVDVIAPAAEAAAGRRLVLMPGLFTVSDALADVLEREKTAVLMGPRSGSKTSDFTIPGDLPPGSLRRLIDVKIRRVESLRPGIAVKAAGSNSDAAFKSWREFIVAGPAAGAGLISEDSHPMVISQGNVTYVGGWANPALLDSVVKRALEAAGVPHMALHRDIRIRDNGPWRYVLNYGPEAVDISAIAGRAELRLGARTLPSCGVALLRRPG